MLNGTDRAVIVHCGGISEFKKIAAMAEAQYIQVSPHINKDGSVEDN